MITPGRILTLVLQYRGVSSRTLAISTDLSESYISLLKRDTRAWTPEICSSIAKCLDCSEELLWGKMTSVNRRIEDLDDIMRKALHQ